MPPTILFIYSLFYFPGNDSAGIIPQSIFYQLTDKNIPSGFIHCLCGFSSFTDCPYYQRLASVHISCCENPRYTGLIGLRFCLYISSCSCCNLKCIGHIFLASKETSCDQHQSAGITSSVPSTGTIIIRPVLAFFLTFQLYDPGLADISVFIFDKIQ